MKAIISYIKRDLWSPYVAGALLGVTGILGVVLSNALLGASGAFENIVGMIGKALAPQAFDNLYFNFVMPPGITWGVWLMVGTFFGGMIGAATSRSLKWGKKDAVISDPQWRRIIGPQVWKRWLLAFFGAALLEYAAGIAGGCTSGLVISGGMLLVPGAFLFMGGFFVGGIILTLLIYRRNY